MPTVIIHWSDTRTDAQKQKVVAGITDALVEVGNARAQDVLVIFQAIESGNAWRGGKPVGQPPQENDHAK